MEPSIPASTSITDSRIPTPHFLTLPAEIRLLIFEHVFSTPTAARLCLKPGFTSSDTDTLIVDDDYQASQRLLPLLTCRQFYLDAQRLAFENTTFLIQNLFTEIPSRLTTTLDPSARQYLRNVAFVADARHFRTLCAWNGTPFGVRPEDLPCTLDTLTIVLHRSSFRHYLFDFTPDVVSMLRSLEGVKRVEIVRNGAAVKGMFRTWYHRLIGFMMKFDHTERYDRAVPARERTWWEWSYDAEAERIILDARPAKPWADTEEDYLRGMKPLMEELRLGVESEEWDGTPQWVW